MPDSSSQQFLRDLDKKLTHFGVVLPPKQIAAGFNQSVDPLVQQIAANIHQSRTLATLLPKLVNGDFQSSRSLCNI